ncbi:hypothetical protein [Methylobrevis pamukkalensis]|uniref:MxaA protein n=1 Tax=Methylobrevis pamukkalensis TaxID=1439726 RepID=A0A1E3H664_9HYPH|nr:hypothetical protein [Methylobrevis pamukkalensis]ODN71803.1 mxaA protein [Methylobrevis pamukkalensis]
MTGDDRHRRPEAAASPSCHSILRRTRKAVRLLALASGLLAALPVSAAEPTVRLEGPRAYGWWIGDLLPLVATVEVDAGLSLDPASLPRVRAVDYWLDLRRLDVTEEAAPEGRRRYRLALDYQTFYAPLEPKAMTIPPVVLRFSGEAGVAEVRVPGFTFVTAPIREIMAPTVPEAMQPLRPLGVIDTRPSQVVAAAGASLALLALAGLAWHHSLGPFRRRPRPFARALREVRRSLARGSDAAALRAAHLALHRAFDSASARTLLAGDLDRFLATHPAYVAAEDGIRDFYAASRRLFFGRGLPDGGGRDPAGTDLVDLARHLAAIERGGAR